MDELTPQTTRDALNTPLERVQRILAAADFPADIVRSDSQHSPDEKLCIGLQVDDQFRQYVLLAEYLPYDEQDPVAVLSWLLVFPFEPPEPGIAPEVARLILLLNRYLPIGHYGLSEEPLGIYYTHRTLVRDPDNPAQQEMVEAVRLIAHLTRSHAPIIDLMLDRRITYNDVREAIAQSNVAPPTLFNVDRPEHAS